MLPAAPARGRQAPEGWVPPPATSLTAPLPLPPEPRLLGPGLGTGQGPSCAGDSKLRVQCGGPAVMRVPQPAEVSRHLRRVLGG